MNNTDNYESYYGKCLLCHHINDRPDICLACKNADKWKAKDVDIAILAGGEILKDLDIHHEKDGLLELAEEFSADALEKWKALCEKKEQAKAEAEKVTAEKNAAIDKAMKLHRQFNQPQTNLDRIRSMKRKELARWLALSMNSDCNDCPLAEICDYSDLECKDIVTSTKLWKKWLKAESGDSDG